MSGVIAWCLWSHCNISKKVPFGTPSMPFVAISNAERYIATAEFHLPREKASSPSSYRAFTGGGVCGGARTTDRLGHTSRTIYSGSMLPDLAVGGFLVL